MASSATDVFVSYKAEDRVRLSPLVKALEAEGFTVWWDAHIGGGTDWREEIQQHLDAARCVIVAWSERSVGSEGRFVRDEASTAQQAGSYVPIKIDAVKPPLGFGEVQAIDFVGWKGKRAAPCFIALVDAVNAHLTGEAPVVRRAVVAEPKVSRRTVMAGGVGALAVAGVGGWALLKPGAAAASNRIAVMSFSNMSGDPAQAYFSDGIAEELRGALSRIGMQVIGKASCDAVKDLAIPAAASKLGVAHILTGSVRRSPETIRVAAQLVNGKDGVEKWAQNYDRAPGDTIKIQSDIATQVASALSVALGAVKKAALIIGGTANAKAQDFYLQAMAVRGRDDTENGSLAAIALLDRALELDPQYAEAYARKAQYIEFWASSFAASVAQKERGQLQAIESARWAIRIAPKLSLGYGALGAIHQDQLQLRRSLEEFQQAEALRGPDLLTLAIYALVLSQARQQAKAISTVEPAIRLDPLNPVGPELQAWILFNGRQYEDSTGVARRALKLDQERHRARAYLGNALLMLGRSDEAAREFQKLPADDYHRLVGEAAIAARAGKRDEARKAIAAIERRYGDSAYYQFAQVYAQAGLLSQGVEALETAWEKRDPGVSSIQVDPFLDPLRKDPRVSAIAARVFG